LPDLTEFFPGDTKPKRARHAARLSSAVVALHSTPLQENAHGYDHRTVAACRDWPRSICRLGARVHRDRPRRRFRQGRRQNSDREPDQARDHHRRREPQLRPPVRDLCAEEQARARAQPAVAGHHQGRRLAGPELRPGPPVQDHCAAERLRQLLHQRQRVEQDALPVPAARRRTSPACGIRRTPSS